MSPTPPLRAVVAFEAAMRHGSFSSAADELNVTPGAVGQQIQKLEEWLGVPLFVRQVRQIVPTPEGRTYYTQVQPALATIIQASRQMRENQHRGLRLSMPPSFAAKWFAPRMTAFLNAHPDISLNLSTSTSFIDFDLDAVDLAVRYFDGDNSGLDLTLIFRDAARLYCSPEYAKRLDLGLPADIVRATLLHNTLHPHWESWLLENSFLSRSQIKSIPGIQFDQSLMAVEAAVRSQGIVLTSELLVAEELASGALMELFDLPLQLPTGYYLAHPKAADPSPNVIAIKLWFIAEMSKR
ncbi:MULTISPECIES: LysR substrate-binding domain-containing protein [Paraburkholderia]|uniref:LysR substrate-binding domain-containing protein n=1 Tax=Paraburkholderia TaxID=1822464 RepID=UPI0006D3E674|nr:MULTISPECIES: LysR substrate-binding domain-containing protein [Paraburkholderia]CAG9221715.1 LysR family transcriptional regulator [Paraburkholderia caribensis]